MKWLYLTKDFIRHGAPLEIYSCALKENKNIIYINFRGFKSDSDVDWLQATICDLPWVTSIFYHSDSHLPAIHRDLLFIKSTYYHMDLITFAKKIRLKLNSFSTYIFMDAGGMYLGPDRLWNNARVLVSFVAPSGKSLILRLKHSGDRTGICVCTDIAISAYYFCILKILCTLY